MAISQHLLRKLHEVLGKDAGDDLVKMLEAADSSRGDIAELRHEMQLGFARLDGSLEKGLKEQTRFFFLAWAVLLAGVIGLYAR